MLHGTYSGHINVSGLTPCSIISDGLTVRPRARLRSASRRTRASDFWNVIGNLIPSSPITTTYNLNLARNTHMVQLGTTALFSGPIFTTIHLPTALRTAISFIHPSSLNCPQRSPWVLRRARSPNFGGAIEFASERRLLQPDCVSTTAFVEEENPRYDTRGF